MNKSLLEEIAELILILPKKDAELGRVLLKERNFRDVLELVESDLYKASKKRKSNNSGGVLGNYISTLIELKEKVITYMSYLEIPKNYDEYDNYY